MKLRRIAVSAAAVLGGLGLAGCYTPQEAYDRCAYSNSVPGTAILHAQWHPDRNRIECVGASINPFGTPRRWCLTPPKSPPDNFWGKGPCPW